MSFFSASMLLKLKVLSKPGLAIVALLFLLEWLGVRSRKVRWVVTVLLTLAVAVASYLEFGRFLIDAGAHIVAGHHPHVQQEPEWYNGGVIIHSMGNFVFD